MSMGAAPVSGVPDIKMSMPPIQLRAQMPNGATFEFECTGSMFDAPHVKWKIPFIRQ